MKSVAQFIRPHLRDISPYRSARDEWRGAARINLDANEIPFESAEAPGYNRYPDSQHLALKSRLAKLHAVAPEQIIVGNGSDELIDLLVRCVCEPPQQGVLIFPPTYGMYEVVARSHNLPVHQIFLSSTFQLASDALATNDLSDVRVTFLCRPNNPTGNLLLPTDKAAEFLQQLPGIIAVDEAYIDFCPEESLVPLLRLIPRLVVLRTFSKAWGMAGLRAGYALGAPEIIGAMSKIKLPYNVNSHTQQVLTAVLDRREDLSRVRQSTAIERRSLASLLAACPLVQEVFPSSANFFLARFYHAEHVFHELLARGIIVRSRMSEPLCANCLRITVGSKEENEAFGRALSEIAHGVKNYA